MAIAESTKMLDKWGIVNQTNSKQTGIPTSKQGIEREIGSVILKKLKEK